MKIATALLIWLCCVQTDDVPPLTPAEQSAMATITENKVVSTVSFLACDELAGRQTPSPELNIAAAYVASRFRGAGLEGLGPDGSFYQETKLPTSLVPSDGIEFECDGVESLGLLAAGSKPFEYTGKVTFVGPRENSPVEGAVCIEAPARRARALVQFRASQMARNGASVLLVVVPKDSSLIADARAAQTVARPVGRFRIPIPILLVSKKPEGNCRLKLPATKKVRSVVRNVIGVLKGSDPELSKEAIVFTAHLDHIGRAAGDDPVNNGADDDASGVTGVLTLADAFGALKTRPKRSVIFMTYWGEEKGMLGSRHFAQHPLWPLRKIVANINIEMIGRADKENESWMTGWEHSDLGKIVGQGASRAGIRIVEKPGLSARLYEQSDNISLVRVGVIAHSFSASGLHSDYHKPGDEWQKIRVAPMTKVIRGLFAGTLPLAHGDATPKKTPAG